MLDGALFDVKVFVDDGKVVWCGGLPTGVVAQRLGGDDYRQVALQSRCHPAKTAFALVAAPRMDIEGVCFVRLAGDVARDDRALPVCHGKIE